MMYAHKRLMNFKFMKKKFFFLSLVWFQTLKWTYLCRTREDGKNAKEWMSMQQKCEWERKKQAIAFRNFIQTHSISAAHFFFVATMLRDGRGQKLINIFHTCNINFKFCLGLGRNKNENAKEARTKAMLNEPNKWHRAGE